MSWTVIGVLHRRVCYYRSGMGGDLMLFGALKVPTVVLFFIRLSYNNK